MDRLSVEDACFDVDQAQNVTMVLRAIDQLLDAIDRLDAPITCDLLRTAMMALVAECGLDDPNHVAAH